MREWKGVQNVSANISTAQRNFTYENAITALKKSSLSAQRGRVFDSAFNSLIRDKESDTILVMGLNGSNADQHLTNAESIKSDHDAPDIANLHMPWGITLDGAPYYSLLQKRLSAILESLQPVLRYLNLEIAEGSVIYTNAYLRCTASQNELAMYVRQKPQLVEDCRQFHWQFTIPTVRPRLIVAFGNSEYDLSAYRFLLDSATKPEYGVIGVSKVHFYRDRHGRVVAKCFQIQCRDEDGRSTRWIPVIAVRHLSRFAFPTLDLENHELKQWINCL
jgi:hypothetical protein